MVKPTQVACGESAPGGARRTEGSQSSPLRCESEGHDASLEEAEALDVSRHGLRCAGRGQPFLPRMDQIGHRAIQGGVRPPGVVVAGEVGQ